jgi:hypothetical protein
MRTLTRQPLDAKQLEQETEKLLQGGDSARLAGLQAADTLQTARTATRRREAARVMAKHGRGSEAMKVATARVDVQERVGQVVRAERERTRVAPFTVEQDRAVIHGRVVDAQGSGQRGYTVTAVDARGNHLASSRTDACGYFKLDLTSRVEAPPVVLVVSRERETVQRHPETFDLRPGSARYVEIVLEQPKRDC